MSHITVSNLAYAHPGGDLLFSDVSFHLAPGRHAALVGTNGVGKTALMKILAGLLHADEGEASVGGRVGYMPQDVGLEAHARSVRELLLALAPAPLRRAGEAVARHERELAEATRTRGSRSARRSPTGPRSAATRRKGTGTRRAGASCARPSRRSRRGRPRPCPEASASAWCWRCCSPPTPMCCCSTSPTTSSTFPRSSSSSGRSVPAARPCSSSPTTASCWRGRSTR